MSQPRPIVGIPTSIIDRPEREIPAHSTSDHYLSAVNGPAGAMAMLVPAMGEAYDYAQLAERLDGLFLTGGRANVEPHHYGGAPFPDDEPIDPRRDATVLPLIRECIAQGIPVFGVCRGLQEINVALGGTLHYRVHHVDGMLDHRMPRVGTHETKFAPRHLISLDPDGAFADLVDCRESKVNSAHGQGIDRLAPGLAVEALAPDGIIEGIRVEGAKTFAMAVQWHAEFGWQEHALSRALFEAFGRAAKTRMKRRRAAEAEKEVG
jgi:putative glutamine amidotransferase